MQPELRTTGLERTKEADKRTYGKAYILVINEIFKNYFKEELEYQVPKY